MRSNKVHKGEQMKLKQEEGRSCLFLDGDMTVNNTEAFKNILLESLRQDDFVEVDFENVTTVDLSCLQLLCSAHRFAAESGKEIVIKDNSIQALQEARVRAGFNFEKSCDFNPSCECLWGGGIEK